MAKDTEEKALAEEMAHSLRNYEPDESIFGAPRAQSGWNGWEGRGWICFFWNT